MSKESKCNCEKVVPVEYRENEDFKDISLTDKLFLSIISHGNVSVRLNNCFAFFTAPCIICLDETCIVEYINSSSLQASSISFNPTFINVNMTFDRIRSEEYIDVANKHDLLLLLPFLKRTDNYMGYIPLDTNLFNMITMQMNKMYNSLNNHADGRWSCRTRTSLMKIIYLLEELYSDYTSTNQHVYNIKDPQTYVYLIIDYIRTHYQNKILCEDLCHIVNINRTTLLNNFKIITGKTITDFIVEYRLNAACHSLRFTQLTIDEIAREYGFKYASYFIRIFENKFKISPTDYRNLKVSERKSEFANIAVCQIN